MSSTGVRRKRTPFDIAIESLRDTDSADIERMKMFSAESSPISGNVGASSTNSATPGGSFLNIAGQTPMLGAIAFNPVLVIIDSNGRLDLTPGTDAPSNYSTYVLMTGAGTPDDLNFIDGAANDGQLLYLQGTTSQVLTIKHAESGIISNIVGTTTVTVTTSVVHGLTTGDLVDISGTTNFNIQNASITVTSTTTFTYAATGSATPETSGNFQNGNVVTSDGSDVILDGTIATDALPWIALLFDPTGGIGGAWRVQFGAGSGGTTLPVIDTTAIVKGSADATKLLRFEVDGFTTATTRTITIPDATTTMAGLGVTSQQWTGTNDFFGITLLKDDASFKLRNGSDITKIVQWDLSAITTATTRTITMPDSNVDLGSITGSFADNLFEIKDDGDNTKIAKFECSAITTATTRTYTLPDDSAGLVTVNTVAAFANKLLKDSTCQFVNVSDQTKKLDFSLGGAATGKTMTLLSSHTDNRTLTFPNATTSLAGLGVTSQQWTGTNDFFGITKMQDINFSIYDNIDATKIAKFECSAITTGTTRTYTLPDDSAGLVTVNTVANFANKNFKDATCAFINNSDNTKKLLFDLSAISTATTRTITMPDADVDLGSITGSFPDDTFDIHDNADATKILQFQLVNLLTATTSFFATEPITSAGKTWTLPNINGTFIMDAGVQTITGAKTWTAIQDHNATVRSGTDGATTLGDSTHHWDDVFTETLSLRGSGGDTTGTKRTIYADATDMVFNVPTGDSYSFKANNVEAIQLNMSPPDIKLVPVSSSFTPSIRIKNSGETENLSLSYSETAQIGGVFSTVNMDINAGTGALGLKGNGTEIIIDSNTATLDDGLDLVLGTSSGTQIATATTQKIGFWAATPVTQGPAYTVTNLTGDRTYDADSTTLAEIADVLGTLLSDLNTIGLFG